MEQDQFENEVPRRNVVGGFAVMTPEQVEQARAAWSEWSDGIADLLAEADDGDDFPPGYDDADEKMLAEAVQNHGTTRDAVLLHERAAQLTDAGDRTLWRDVDVVRACCNGLAPAPVDLLAVLAALPIETAAAAQQAYERELHDDARADTLGEEHRQGDDVPDELVPWVRFMAQANTSGDPAVDELVAHVRKT